MYLLIKTLAILINFATNLVKKANVLRFYIHYFFRLKQNGTDFVFFYLLSCLLIVIKQR